jgi:predicted transcriptional regulator YdeE
MSFLDLFGKIPSDPEMVSLGEPIRAVGLMVRTDMESVFKDVAEILKEYRKYKDEFGIPDQKEPWEYVSLSANFQGNQSWDYYTGNVVETVDNVPDMLRSFEIPAGDYAVFPIRPKHKRLLGLTIARTKRYIYNEWMPRSKYEFAGYEFEYNNQEMHEASPHFIDLYVSVKEKSR